MGRLFSCAVTDKRSACACGAVHVADGLIYGVELLSLTLHDDAALTANLGNRRILRDALYALLENDIAVRVE